MFGAKLLRPILPTADIAQSADDTKAVQPGHGSLGSFGKVKAESIDPPLAQRKRLGLEGFPSIVSPWDEGPLNLFVPSPCENHHPDSLPCPTNFFA